MDSSTPVVSPLRQRMIDDMRMRKLNPKTQSGYLRAVKRFAAYLGRSPDTATVEDLRNYQLHLAVFSRCQRHLQAGRPQAAADLADAAARSRDRGCPLALSDDDAPKEVLLGDAGLIGIG